jgi:hypothetical protein
VFRDNVITSRDNGPKDESANLIRHGQSSQFRIIHVAGGIAGLLAATQPFAVVFASQFYSHMGKRPTRTAMHHGARNDL